MQLTSQHISQLYKFTRAHYVEWYDLQTELVDHLANDIEQIWEKEPSLSFDQAKNKAFKKFGVFGFYDVIAEKSNALNSSYWKMVWKICKDYFKLPKIIIVLLLATIVFTLLNFLESKYIFVLVTITIISIIPIAYTFYNSYKLKKRFKKTKVKWMFEENLKILGGFFFISIQIPNLLVNLFKFESMDNNFTTLYITSLAIVLFSVFTYIIVKIIPLKMKIQMAKLYPEYNLYKKA